MSFRTTCMFHEQLGFPEYVRQQLHPRVTLSLDPTPHARDRATTASSLHPRDREDTQVHIAIPDSIQVTLDDIFEVGVDGHGHVTELGFRTSQFTVRNTPRTYEAYDLCFSTNPCGRVFTVYLNHQADTHDTLNTDKYAEPCSLD